MAAAMHCYGTRGLSFASCGTNWPSDSMVLDSLSTDKLTTERYTDFQIPNAQPRTVAMDITCSHSEKLLFVKELLEVVQLPCRQHNADEQRPNAEPCHPRVGRLCTQNRQPSPFRTIGSSTVHLAPPKR